MARRLVTSVAQGVEYAATKVADAAHKMGKEPDTRDLIRLHEKYTVTIFSDVFNRPHPIPKKKSGECIHKGDEYFYLWDLTDGKIYVLFYHQIQVSTLNPENDAIRKEIKQLYYHYANEGIEMTPSYKADLDAFLVNPSTQAYTVIQKARRDIRGPVDVDDLPQCEQFYAYYKHYSKGTAKGSDTMEAAYNKFMADGNIDTLVDIGKTYPFAQCKKKDGDTDIKGFSGQQGDSPEVVIPQGDSPEVVGPQGDSPEVVSPEVEDLLRKKSLLSEAEKTRKQRECLESLLSEIEASIKTLSSESTSNIKIKLYTLHEIKQKIFDVNKRVTEMSVKAASNVLEYYEEKKEKEKGGVSYLDDEYKEALTKLELEQQKMVEVNESSESFDTYFKKMKGPNFKSSDAEERATLLSYWNSLIDKCFKQSEQLPDGRQYVERTFKEGQLAGILEQRIKELKDKKTDLTPDEQKGLTSMEEILPTLSKDPVDTPSPSLLSNVNAFFSRLIGDVTSKLKEEAADVYLLYESTKKSKSESIQESKPKSLESVLEKESLDEGDVRFLKKEVQELSDVIANLEELKDKEITRALKTAKDAAAKAKGHADNARKAAERAASAEVEAGELDGELEGEPARGPVGGPEGESGGELGGELGGGPEGGPEGELEGGPVGRPEGGPVRHVGGARTLKQLLAALEIAKREAASAKSAAEEAKNAADETAKKHVSISAVIEANKYAVEAAESALDASNSVVRIMELVTIMTQVEREIDKLPCPPSHEIVDYRQQLEAAEEKFEKAKNALLPQVSLLSAATKKEKEAERQLAAAKERAALAVEQSIAATKKEKEAERQLAAATERAALAVEQSAAAARAEVEAARAEAEAAREAEAAARAEAEAAKKAEAAARTEAEAARAEAEAAKKAEAAARTEAEAAREAEAAAREEVDKEWGADMAEAVPQENKAAAEAVAQANKAAEEAVAQAKKAAAEAVAQAKKAAEEEAEAARVAAMAEVEQAMREKAEAVADMKIAIAEASEAKAAAEEAKSKKETAEAEMRKASEENALAADKKVQAAEEQVNEVRKQAKEAVAAAEFAKTQESTQARAAVEQAMIEKEEAIAAAKAATVAMAASNSMQQTSAINAALKLKELAEARARAAEATAVEADEKARAAEARARAADAKVAEAEGKARAAEEVEKAASKAAIDGAEASAAAAAANTRAAAAEAEKAKALDMLKELRGEVEDIKEEHLQHQARLAALIDSEKTKVATLKSEKEATEASEQIIKEQLKRATDEKKDAQEMSQQVTQTNLAQGEQIKELETQLSRCLEEKDALISEKKDIETQLAQKGELNAELEKKYKTAQDGILFKEAELHELDEEIKKLKLQLETPVSKDTPEKTALTMVPEEWPDAPRARVRNVVEVKPRKLSPYEELDNELSQMTKEKTLDLITLISRYLHFLSLNVPDPHNYESRITASIKSSIRKKKPYTPSEDAESIFNDAIQLIKTIKIAKAKTDDYPHILEEFRKFIQAHHRETGNVHPFYNIMKTHIVTEMKLKDRLYQFITTSDEFSTPISPRTPQHQTGTSRLTPRSDGPSPNSQGNSPDSKGPLGPVTSFRGQGRRGGGKSFCIVNWLMETDVLTFTEAITVDYLQHLLLLKYKQPIFIILINQSGFIPPDKGAMINQNTLCAIVYDAQIPSSGLTF